MKLVEAKIDRNSAIGLFYQGQVFTENLSPSIPELIEVDKKEGAAMKMLCDTFYHGLDISPVLITSKGGAFSGAYGPTICQKDGVVVLSAGLKEVPLVLKTDAKGKNFYIDSEDEEIEVDIIETEFNGYKNPSVALSWVKDGFIMCVYLSLKMRRPGEGETAPSIRQLKVMLSDLPSLAGWLMDPPKQSVNKIPLKYLEPGFYEVTDYQYWVSKADGEPKASFTIKGTQDENGLFIQQYKNPVDDKQKADLSIAEVEPLETIGVFLPKKFLAKLEQDPDISEDKPATLVVSSVKPSKNGKGYSVDASVTYNPDQTFRAIEESKEDMSFLDLVI